LPEATFARSDICQKRHLPEATFARSGPLVLPSWMQTVTTKVLAS